MNMSAAKSKFPKTSPKKQSSNTKKQEEKRKSSVSSKSPSKSETISNKKTSTKKSVQKKAVEKKTVSTRNKKADQKTTKNKSTTTCKSNIKKTTPKKKSSHMVVPEFPTTKWGESSVLSFEATQNLPPTKLTSIAGGFVFHDDKLVLANIPGRGWEIVGGRIDVGESPENTFRREAMNQLGCTLSHIEMLGVMRIEHLGPEPPNCPYPFPVGYGIQFIGIVDEFFSSSGGAQSLGRSLISPEGFKKHYYDWNEYYDAVFRYAYERYMKLKKKLKL